jgi:hypothetical protein
MKKYFPVLIGFSTLFLGIVSICIWYSFYPTKYSFNEVISAKIPKTNYCEVINSPLKYNNKIVRLNTNLNWFMHGFYLADDNCRGEGDTTKTAITFNESFRANRPEYLKELTSANPVEIIAVGIFRYNVFTGSSDSIEERTRLHFEIYSIEYVAK